MEDRIAKLTYKSSNSKILHRLKLQTHRPLEVLSQDFVEWFLGVMQHSTTPNPASFARSGGRRGMHIVVEAGCQISKAVEATQRAAELPSESALLEAYAAVQVAPYQCYVEKEDAYLFCPADNDIHITRGGLAPRDQLFHGVSDRRTTLAYLQGIVERHGLDVGILGYDLLLEAAEAGHAPALRWLVAEVGVRASEVRDSGARNILHRAVRGKDAIAIFKLLAYDANSDSGAENREEGTHDEGQDQEDNEPVNAGPAQTSSHAAANIGSASRRTDVPLECDGGSSVHADADDNRGGEAQGTEHGSHWEEVLKSMGVTKLLQQTDSQSQSLLHSIAFIGNAEVLEILLDRNGMLRREMKNAYKPPDRKSGVGEHVEPWMWKSEMDSYMYAWHDKRGRTPREVASMLGNQSVVALLDQHVFDFQRKCASFDPPWQADLRAIPLTERRWIALNRAAKYASEGAYLDLVVLLVDVWGASVSLSIESCEDAEVGELLGLGVLPAVTHNLVHAALRGQSYRHADRVSREIRDEYEIGLALSWDGKSKDIADALCARFAVNSSIDQAKLLQAKLAQLRVQDAACVRLVAWLVQHKHCALPAPHLLVAWHRVAVLRWMVTAGHVILDEEPLAEETLVIYATSLTWLGAKDSGTQVSRGEEESRGSICSRRGLLCLLAAGHNELRVLQYLLEDWEPHEAAQIVYWGRNLLHVAASRNALEVLIWLVRGRRFPVTALTRCGHSASHLAARCGHLFACKFLHSAGCPHVDAAGRDVYWHAAESGVERLQQWAENTRAYMRFWELIGQMERTVFDPAATASSIEYDTAAVAALGPAQVSQDICEVDQIIDTLNKVLEQLACVGHTAAFASLWSWAQTPEYLFTRDFRPGPEVSNAKARLLATARLHSQEGVMGVLLKEEEMKAAEKRRREVVRRLNAAFINGEEVGAVEQKLAAALALGPLEDSGDSFFCSKGLLHHNINRSMLSLSDFPLSAVVYAAQEGFLHLVQWALDTHRITPSSVAAALGAALVVAAEYGQLAVVELLLPRVAVTAEGGEAALEALVAAAHGAQLEAVQRMYAHVVQTGGDVNACVHAFHFWPVTSSKCSALSAPWLQLSHHELLRRHKSQHEAGKTPQVPEQEPLSQLRSATHARARALIHAHTHLHEARKTPQVPEQELHEARKNPQVPEQEQQENSGKSFQWFEVLRWLVAQDETDINAEVGDDSSLMVHLFDPLRTVSVGSSGYTWLLRIFKLLVGSGARVSEHSEAILDHLAYRRFKGGEGEEQMLEVVRILSEECRLDIQGIQVCRVGCGGYVAGVERLRTEQVERWRLVDAVERGSSLEQLRKLAGSVRCDTSVLDTKGRGLLHVAAGHDRAEVIRWAVEELGADPRLIDARGRTARQVAGVAGASAAAGTLRQLEAERVVAAAVAAHFRRRRAAREAARRRGALLAMQAMWRGRQVRGMYRAHLVAGLPERQQFTQTWGRAVASVAELAASPSGAPLFRAASWQAVRQERFDLVADADVAPLEDEQDDALSCATSAHLRAATSAVLSADAAGSALMDGEEEEEATGMGEGGGGEVEEAGGGRGGGIAGDGEPHGAQRPMDGLKLTAEALKWYEHADARCAAAFVRRLGQLAGGQRSRILAKHLTGCRHTIFETYLDQATAQRILWTECREPGGADGAAGAGARSILVWYVCKHKWVPRYLRLIDHASARQVRRRVVDPPAAVPSVPADMTQADWAQEEGEGALVLGGDEVLLDPMGNTPLQLHHLRREDLPRLTAHRTWKPPLHLTAAELAVVERPGTVLLLGRSGTGKTLCVCNRMAYDHDRSATARRPLRQLFVARSRRVCDLVRRLREQHADASLTPPSFGEFLPAPPSPAGTPAAPASGAEFCTFEGLLCRCLEMAGGRLPRQERGRFIRSRRVDFPIFKREAALLLKRHSSLDPLIIWRQIQSSIKGSIEAVMQGHFLTLDEYLALGAERCGLSPAQRRSAYAGFQAYQALCADKRWWDDADRIFALVTCMEPQAWSPERPPLPECHVDKVYVDEVQDYTQAEVALLFMLADTRSLFLAGDTAQAVVEGVEFRFQEVRSVAYRLSNGDRAGIPDKPQKLHLNFRSHSGVLDVAGAVLGRLFAAFPSAADKLPADRALFRGPRPGYLQGAPLAQILEDERLVLLTPDYHLGVLRHVAMELPGGCHSVLLGIAEAKGLEFPEVAVVDFFSHLSPGHQRAWKRLLQADAGMLGSTFRDECPELECQLKLLYTAVTRCCRRLVLVETTRSAAADAFFRWLSSQGMAEKYISGEPGTARLTNDEWRVRGIDYALNAEAAESMKEKIPWLTRAVRHNSQVAMMVR
ncbi:hypothetical protein CYMTET_29619 [Cymbomonas tetramitiformis]|uniref:UvrD-like helicase ATP-binding domain-containing protein n=1 Tax=Cymbomonas tetramitiformis TaxID=36881 RepID=A0AAE0FKD9_9CHLO|nr:hypothetical protein CYMTET_29619 [Cymbomonas tetramitiformis]